MPRRGKVEMYIEVLEIISKGETKPTRIMYSANLSWKVFQSVLGNLLTQNLVSEGDEGGDGRDVKRYRVTESGLNVLTYFRKATMSLPKN
jgi:predicted transcriptional regulator